MSKLTELTAKEKAKILRRALKILGPNGENWTKNKWFGRKTRPDKASRDGSQLSTAVAAKEADCWCVLGALEEAACQLGYIDRPKPYMRLGSATSLKKLVKALPPPSRYWGTWSGIPEFNDSSTTTWNDVKNALEGRIKQLRKES